MAQNRFGIGDLIMVIKPHEDDPSWVKSHPYIIGKPMKVIGVYRDPNTMNIWYKTEEDKKAGYYDDWVEDYSVRSVREFIGVENPKTNEFLAKMERMENKTRKTMLYLSEFDALNILVDAEIENNVDASQATYVNVTAIERMKQLSKKNLAKGDVHAT